MDQVCPLPDDGEHRWMQESGRDLLSGGAIISNGVIKLGLFSEGALNAMGVGLIFMKPSGVEVESTYHGCPCEGWGASASRTSNGASFSGYANNGRSTANIVSQPILSNGVTAFIDTTLATGPLRVTHSYFPSPDTSNMYVADVTYENTDSTETLTNLRYRRVMDWDIPPFLYNECVTIDVGTSNSVEAVSNSGFASTDPLLSVASGSTASSYDIGPRDHGALLQFLFKKPDDGALVTLAPGETFTFQILYGAAANKADAAQALANVGAEVSHLDL